MNLLRYECDIFNIEFQNGSQRTYVLTYPLTLIIKNNGTFATTFAPKKISFFGFIDEFQNRIVLSKYGHMCLY